ncbi:MAG: hypothetical protein A2427_02150 [Candidatus Nealsonbacteria bacterium RIFOXYC1_FULL_40_7]|uniref:Uncharacterized protein n=1 Tax=Candidatus Nealsonbacteria bacterium RIFOXYC1_FULL_40_7 TaxID=1801678 RepID=A0A1G2ERS0_9BACT|nr:MAG: hypothetical protein A2427_02150 [Candidatus Nealsonbacteria bacterium RIFOXYC1_FULL_40_7]OGZ28700.1 MAG: hypothetical protein A2562_00625 [Candidatus Nealsonbacteria bacterium RIFOXYD1_FULL_39_11]
MEKARKAVVWTVGNSWWILFLIALAFGWDRIWTWSSPADAIVKPWYPAKYTIANIVEGKYTSIGEVSLSGTAVYVSSAEEYRENFKSADHSVIQQKDGTRYFLCKIGDKTYVLREWRKLRGIRTQSVINMDASSGSVWLHFSRSYFPVIGFGFIWTILCGCFLLSDEARRKTEEWSRRLEQRWIFA